MRFKLEQHTFMYLLTLQRYVYLLISLQVIGLKTENM
jgi:hypothetical protein